jgi:hypothetical protein
MPETCPICEEDLAAPNVVSCHACMRDFHLQVRMDVAGKDCGDAWLHEEMLHVVFGCRECITSGAFIEDPRRGRQF